MPAGTKEGVCRWLSMEQVWNCCCPNFWVIPACPSDPHPQIANAGGPLTSSNPDLPFYRWEPWGPGREATCPSFHSAVRARVQVCGLPVWFCVPTLICALWAWWPLAGDLAGQFCHLERGDNNISLSGSLWGINEIMQVKCFCSLTSGRWCVLRKK